MTSFGAVICVFSLSFCGLIYDTFGFMTGVSGSGAGGGILPVPGSPLRPFWHPGKAVCLRVVLKYFDCDTFYGLVLLLELFLL